MGIADSKHASGDVMFREASVSMLMKRLRRLSADIGNDRRGAAAIEFAIVAIPFLLFVFMIFQIALYHFGLQSLDYATRLAARQIMLGQVASASQSKAGFKTGVVCPRFLMGFNCADVVVNATKVSAGASQGPGASLSQFVDASNLRLQSVSTGSFCIGGPGDYIFLDVSYVFPNFVGALFTGTGITSSTFKLRSTSFFRNEPFKTAAAVC